MSSTALQLVEKRQPEQELQRQVGALQLRTLEDFQTLGQVFVKSGFFADTKDAAQAIVKVMAGAELGFPAIASMTGVYIVKGKVSLSANLIASAIKRSGKYNYRVKELSTQAAEIEFFEAGASIGVSRFTMVEAKGASLSDNPTWQKFPRNMLFARAMSNGAKWFCPDIFGGPIYTPDELGATIDGESGEVIEMPREEPMISEESIHYPRRPQPEQTKDLAPAVEMVSLKTLHAIETLWPKFGVKVDGQSVSFGAYLKQKKGIADPSEMPRLDGEKMLHWLQQKALAVETPAEEPKADQGAGLDQWLCTQEIGSRSLAMDVLNVTKRLEATGVTETEWRVELNEIYRDYPQPVSRKSLTAEELRETWLPLIEGWAKRNEAKKF